jgi:calcineurin-like phosphoesterase family protein
MAVYACSDLHGMLHFYKAIKEFLQPEDKIYFLGDAGDRGPEPWETVKAILKDEQFIYIKGNHDDMLADALTEYAEEGYVSYNSARLLHINGGDETLSQAITEPSVGAYASKLMHLDTYVEYINTQGQKVILSHAGFTPWKDDEDKLCIPKFQDLIWDRTHFFDEWTEEDCEDCYIVHGHTPIPYLLDEIDPACLMGDIKPGALWYDGGRKCCVDAGAVFTGYCVLLDLDTWEEQVFNTEPYL